MISSHVFSRIPKSRRETLQYSLIDRDSRNTLKMVDIWSGDIVVTGDDTIQGWHSQ